MSGIATTRMGPHGLAFYDDGTSNLDRLKADNAALRPALERARGCITGLLARTPVRDVAETLAEIDAALAEPHTVLHSEKP